MLIPTQSKIINTEKVLERIESEGHRMIVGPVKGEILEKLAILKKPKRILEVGTNVGYSAILLASSYPKSKITSIEINSGYKHEAEKNIKEAGLEKRIDVKLGDALDVIPKLSEKYDYMFIDAIKEDYLNYLKLAEKKLNKGAVIISDNVKIFENEMQDFLRYVRNNGKYKSMACDVGFDAVEVSLKST